MSRFPSRHPYFVVSGESLAQRPRLEHLAQVPEGATTPGRWVDAVDLRAGDELLLRDGRIEPVVQLRVYAFFGLVYNFEVEDLHCYAVGHSSVLVHNNNGPDRTINDPVPRAGRPTSRARPRCSGGGTHGDWYGAGPPRCALSESHSTVSTRIYVRWEW